MADRTPRRVQSYTGGRDDLELTPCKIVAGTPSGEVQMRVPVSDLGAGPRSPEIRGKADKGKGDIQLREKYAELLEQFEKLSEEFRVALDGSDSVDILYPPSQPRQVQGRNNRALAASGNKGLHQISSTDLKSPTIDQGCANAAEGSTEGFQSTGSVPGPVHSRGETSTALLQEPAGLRGRYQISLAGGSENHMPNCEPPPKFNENVTTIPNTNNYVVNRRINVPTTNKSSYKKPPTYDGTSSWQDYLVQFVLLGKGNQWTQEEKAMELATSLRGAAVAILSDLGVQDREDYNCLVSALAARFEPTNQSEIFRSQVKSRVREKGESLPELAQDVKRLVRFAYPTAGVELRDQLALDCFIDSLGDAEMQWSVHQNGPKSVDHAVSVALKYEAFHASRKKQGMPRPVRTQSEVAEEQNEMADAVRKVEQTLEKLTQLVGASNKNKGQGNYNRCHYCGMAGHFRKNCNKRKKDLEDTVQQCQINQETNRNAESYHLSGNGPRLG